MSGDESQKQTGSRKGTVIYVIFGLLVVGVALLLSASLRAERETYLASETRQRTASVKAGPKVKYVTAQTAHPERVIEVVGEARPYNQATLYAKVSGYLREVRVDYGDRVTQGQVLAVIESPELDRQYEAAVEDSKNKENEAKRGWTLLPRGGISIEEAQSRETAAQMAKAVAASLLAQKQYEIIQAPFAGVVTARYADPGALVQNAQTTQVASLPVVTISQVDKLKVYAYSDQRNANFIKVGDAAEIWDATRSESRFPATVSRTSVQLNATTRTLLLQFDVDNKQGVLVPGSFVRVALTIKTPPRVAVPAEALVYRMGDPYVAVIAEGNTVHYRSVAIAFSDGKTVRLMSGVEAGERVALNLGAGVAEGERVRPVSAERQ